MYGWVYPTIQYHAKPEHIYLFIIVCFQYLRGHPTQKEELESHGG